MINPKQLIDFISRALTSRSLRWGNLDGFRYIAIAMYVRTRL